MAVDIIVAILIGLAWGFMVMLPVLIAAGKGRNPWLWGILGLFFPIITLLVLLILPARPDRLSMDRAP